MKIEALLFGSDLDVDDRVTQFPKHINQFLVDVALGTGSLWCTRLLQLTPFDHLLLRNAWC